MGCSLCEGTRQCHTNIHVRLFRFSILAMLTHRFRRARPTESDEEYDEDSEDDLDDELMETMLGAEFEDGTKGQNILEPDDLCDIIRVQVPPDIMHMDDG